MRVLPVLLAVAWPLAAIPVNDLSVAQYTTYLDSLYTHDGANRGLAGAEHDLARTYIRDAFIGFGLTTSLDPFTYSGSTYYNVVGLLPGAVYPDRYYIVGAHYDSAGNPGADDNGSGVAGVLEAARVLSAYHFQSSLLFIAFDAEEAGLKGSWAYAGAHTTNNIRGMVALDMIAYDDGTHQAIVECTSSSALKTTLVGALSTYSGITATTGTESGSDHYPFEAYGFPGCLIIENAVRNNPHYHTALDSVDTPNYIDYAFGTNMTKAAVGYLSDSAMLTPEPAFTALVIAAALGFIIRRRSAGA